MDGSSTLHTLRWKQICAGALSAASLIAGHLVFGQEAQPRRTSPIAHTAEAQPARIGVKPATQGEVLAPVLDARSKPKSKSSTPVVSNKPSSEALPPIIKGKKLPKAVPAEATSDPLGERGGQTDEPRPVATLELKPKSTNTSSEKPSSVSPWMIDINEAIAANGSSTAKVENRSGSESKADTKTPAKSAPASFAAEVARPSVGGGSYPVAQLGTPKPTEAGSTEGTNASSYASRSPADLRKSSTESHTTTTHPQAQPTPQFNPFIGSATAGTAAAGIKAPTVPKTADAASEKTAVAAAPAVAPKLIAPVSPPEMKSPAKVEHSAVALPPIDVDAQTEPVAIAPPTIRPAVEEPPPQQANDNSSPLPPVVAPNSIQKAAAAAPAPGQSPWAQAEARPAPVTPAPVTPAPARERTGVSPTATPRSEPAPRVENAYRQRSTATASRLQLTGYETQDQAFGSQEPTLAAPQRNAPSDSQFTQADAPRPLPGMPAGPFEMIGESGTVSVMVRRSMLLRTRTDIYRTAVVDPGVCEVIQFTPREVSIIGKSQGSTHVTFWFDGADSQPITYLVKVEPDSAEVKKEEDKYKLLEDVVNEMFPDSKIQLLLVADKLIVKGQAKDSEDATQIMAIIRTNASGGGGGGGGAWGPGGWNGGAGGGLSEGVAADVLSDSATGSAARARYQVINMLRVPGVQQVALRVKIAELNRTAARGFGVDVRGNVAFSDSPEGTDLFFNSILNVAGGGAPALLAQFDGDDISVGIRYLQQQGVIRLLSEPTLVTMSGRPATFVAGGEFAVPTVVGSAGLNAVTTDFRAFGAIISFLPTVVDKDRIRLEVSPEFSQINQDLAVGGTPGLKTRAVTTTVEMREGQTFAIAGLLEDNMNGTTIGDLPFLAQIFGRRSMQRAETELIILVTPELVHAMEAEEVPPLPGFDVTEPDNAQFFLHGKIEGTPTREYRSTVWPRLKNRYKAGGPAMTSGPFGHGQ